MQEIIKILIGISILILGFFLGNYLAKITKEELTPGQIWFKLLIFLCLIGILVSLILRHDVLLFTFAFIAIVTSRSLKSKTNRRSK